MAECGCLENSTGNEIVFQRRKKRINDIIDASGNALDAGALAPFLHGVEPELFESLYGIDHGALPIKFENVEIIEKGVED